LLRSLLLNESFLDLFGGVFDTAPLIDWFNFLFDDDFTFAFSVPRKCSSLKLGDFALEK
jgi:hypothetical protein